MQVFIAYLGKVKALSSLVVDPFDSFDRGLCEVLVSRELEAIFVDHTRFIAPCSTSFLFCALNHLHVVRGKVEVSLGTQLPHDWFRSCNLPRFFYPACHKNLAVRSANCSRASLLCQNVDITNAQ